MSRKSYPILMFLRESSSALKESIKHIKLTHACIGIVPDHQNMIKFSKYVHDADWMLPITGQDLSYINAAGCRSGCLG